MLRESRGNGLERIGQAAAHEVDKLARGCTAQALDFAGHVRLVGVACEESQCGEVVVFGPKRELKETLEAEDAVERLESVAKGIETAAAQAAFAESEIGGELMERESRRGAVVACGAAEKCELRVGSWDGGQSADKQSFEVGGEQAGASALGSPIEEARGIVVPELRKGNTKIHEMVERLAKPGMSGAGMETNSDKSGAAERASENGSGVGSGNAEGIAGPDNIDAAVGHNLQ